jgi:hypothetical protein
MRVALIGLGLFLCGTAPLFAQETPQFELAGSYAFMRDTSRSDSFPAGWAVAATGNVKNWIGVVAEVGGNYSSCENCARGPFASQRFLGTNLRIAIHTYLAGPRVVAHAGSLLTPFAQMLVGGSHMSGGTEFDGALNSGLTYQPGAGVDVRIARNTAVRLQGDYRIIRTSGRNNKESRFLVGIVLSRGRL